MSQWLDLMLGEIARKRAELEQQRAETARRELERMAANPALAAAGVHSTTDTHVTSHAAQRPAGK